MQVTNVREMTTSHDCSAHACLKPGEVEFDGEWFCLEHVQVGETRVAQNGDPAALSVADRRAAVRRLAARGESQRAIAAQLKVNRSTVQNDLRALGAPAMPAVEKTVDETPDPSPEPESRESLEDRARELVELGRAVDEAVAAWSAAVERLGQQPAPVR